MTDLIIVFIMVIICGAAAGYIYKAKKRGVKCIGCAVGEGGCCCSHGGAGNIIRETEKTWPGKKIHALVGGLHLFRSSDDEVRAVAEQIKTLGIEKIYTGHCTGARQMEILKEELGSVVEQIYTGMEIQV